MPLAFQEEQLLIVPIPDLPEDLKVILSEAGRLRRVVVLLKIGKKWTWVKPLLEELDLLESSIFAERVGFSDQRIVRASDLSPESKQYFSLLLIRQSWPSTMP